MTIEQSQASGLAELVEHLDRVVVGKGPELQVVLAAILAGGHVLIEDVPGVGKTCLLYPSDASDHGSG